VHHEGEGLTPDNRVAWEPRLPGGFDDFFLAEYRSMVTALMFLEHAGQAEADDCVAAAMEKLLLRWYLPESHPRYVHRPRRYVLTVARNCFRRERQRARTVALDDEPAADESAMTVMESRQVVAELLRCLSAGQRRVIHLICEGYTPTEIAEILRKKPNNVRQIAWQARKQLRRLVEPPAGGSAEREEGS
jgi:RNA polymerase sigma factor (sigma-70 family)